MDFIKKVLFIAVVYFIIVLLWILFEEKKVHLSLLALQALTFGIIISGFLYFYKGDVSSLSEKTGIKKE